MAGHHGRRHARAGALLLAGAMLALAGCEPPGTGGSGPDLGEDDVVTLVEPHASLDGYFGSTVTEVGKDSMTTRFEMPDGTEIYAATEEMDPWRREEVVEAAQEYIGWRAGIRDPAPCTDIGSTTVRITGAVEHESEMQDCAPDTPLRALRLTIDDSRGPDAEHRAHPYEDWTIEVRPWSGDGPDESAPVERYLLRRGEFRTLMYMSAENAPAGWGEDLVPGAEEGERALDEAATASVMKDLNGFLLGQDQMGCGDPSGEVRVIREGIPALQWTYRLCADEHSEVLVGTLRGM